MARFKNSNRSAADEMNYTAKRKRRSTTDSELENSYFRRLGFDFAMI